VGCNAAGSQNNAVTEANMVTGVVLDTKGKPIAGAKVRAENPTGYNIHVDGTTDANGKYTLKLTSIGGWVIYAWKTITTEDGDTYHLRIAGEKESDYAAFAPGKTPVVRNFRWKLTGAIPDRPQAPDFSSGYFGGSLRFVNDHYNENGGGATEMPEGTVITVTLTPVAGAKYLDGTPATQVITKTFKIKQRVPRDVNFYIGDIPVTEYTVSAKTNTGKEVYLGRNKFNYSEHVQQSTASFYPALGSSGSYESGIGVGAAYNFPYYMSMR
jgi:hypothetical protein